MKSTRVGGRIMESIQFPSAHAGLLTRLSRFIKSCAPYGITAPGYSIIYATANVYRALGILIAQSALANLPSQTVEGYLHKEEVLLNILNLGNKRRKGFTTLYENGRSDYSQCIKRHPVTKGVLRLLCATLSLVATTLCVVKTLVMSALAIALCAVALPFVPLFFLLCTTVAIERYAVARVRVAFRTSVPESIGNCIKEIMSFGHNKKVGKPRDPLAALSEEDLLTKSTKELNDRPSAFVSFVSSTISTLGEVIALAVCIPVFMLVAPISLAISGSITLLSLCSLSKSTIDKNVETMGHYAINDFLPVTAKAHDDMQAYGSLYELDGPTFEYESIASLSSLSFEDDIDDIDPFLTPITPTPAPSAWSSRTSLNRENSTGTGRAPGM
ncbi:hypothetical protein [Anaplasma bovis]|uniref:hypothetical protein n=1 Tax=Anaplasma bovis TaxID=186733 RepID=UPI002FF125A9